MKENKIKEAFSYIRAPEGVLREVNMKIEQTEAKNKHEKPRRYGKLIPIAIALAAILALSVAAYGFMHSDFYKNAFGTGVESQTVGNIDLYDADGNYVKSDFVPSYERVEVDDAKAEELVGGAVTPINKPFELNDYTVTILDALMDDNGLGMVTVEIEHPEGHTKYSDWYMEKIPPYCENEYFMTCDGENYPADCALIADKSTETKAHLIYYLSPLCEADSHKDLKYVFMAATELGRSISNKSVIKPKGEAQYTIDELFDTIEIPIAVEKRVETSTLVWNGRTMRISPLGATFSLDDIPIPADREFTSFVITYDDGAKYIVKDDSHSNMDGGIKDDAGNVRVLFNRLVDVDEIESISITTQDGVERIFTRP